MGMLVGRSVPCEPVSCSCQAGKVGGRKAWDEDQKGPLVIMRD